MRRRLAAIMAADVVGYTRLMAEDEAGTHGLLRATLAEVVAPAVARHGGRVFKTTGDGFLAAFDSAGEALDAAVEVQEGMASRPPLALRIGINLGDVIEEGDGDLFGDGVNVAARLEAMADPGGVAVSGAVARGAGRREGLRFARRGYRRGKNMPEAVEVFAVRWRGQAPPLPRAGAWPARRAAAAAAALALLAGGAGAGVWAYGGRGDPSPAAVMAASPPPAAATDADGRPAVAVLPFDNLSGDPGQDYFSDGLTEDIITDLARNGELPVIARNSTFAFKDRPADVRAIGAGLGARYLVEGSARRAGGQVRVVAQLIDAQSGAHLWSRSYDRGVEDVFAVQADLTSQIVASLVSYVRRSEVEGEAARPTASPRAYDLVLRGRERHRHGSQDAGALLEARALYARAVELDPGYAAAHAHLGLTRIVDHAGRVTGAATRADLDEGLARAREAIRLKPDLPLSYQVLSFGLAEAGDYEGALRAAGRAVELNPSDPEALMALAKAQVRFGAYGEAVANAARARRLNPIAPEYYPYVHGQALYADGRAEEADGVLADCLLRTPQERNCLRMSAAVLARLGRAPEARAAMARLVALDPAFSLAAERAARRFGDSPLMARYLDDLAAAGTPEGPGQAAGPAGAAPA